jgi:hypothetical protein
MPICGCQHSIIITCTKDESIFKEEKLILAHGFRGSSPWLLGPVALGL